MVKRKRDQVEVTRAATDWLLVTGQPSCGKTTAVKRLVKLLQSKGVRCKGFYTEEVVNGSGARVGFDVVTIPDGKRDVLSRKEGFFKSKYKTGQYYVDRESFEDLALPSLSTEGIIDDDDKESTVFVLDEIGRMELHSTKFSEQVRRLLDEGVKLIGAITAPIYGHRVPFCDEISSLDGVSVFKLTKKTRDVVVEDLLDLIEKKWLAKLK